MSSKEYFLYILRCSDNSLYTGIARDIQKRLKVHESSRGSKYVAGRLPVSVVYTEGPFANAGDAMRREHAIKKLTRAQKEELVQSK